jgi:hypothetical protein
MAKPTALERACMAIAAEVFLGASDVHVAYKPHPIWHERTDEQLKTYPADLANPPLHVDAGPTPLDLSREDVRAALMAGGRLLAAFISCQLATAQDEVEALFRAEERLFELCPAADKYRDEPFAALLSDHVEPRVFSLAAQYAAADLANDTSFRGAHG